MKKGNDYLDALLKRIAELRSKAAVYILKGNYSALKRSTRHIKRFEDHLNFISKD